MAGFAEGTLRSAVENTNLAAFPVNLSAGPEVTKAVAHRLAAFGKLARVAINTADEAGDKDTADLFTGVSRQIDEDLWFTEAHLQ